MADSQSNSSDPNSSGFLGRKASLILAHLYLLPWFARRCFHCELPLRPFLNANPDLELGGLPIAPKLSRYGSDPPYLPCLIIDPTTERETLEVFAAEHSFPLVLKPLFGSQSRGVKKVSSLREVETSTGEEPMIVQPYVDVPKEYGINVIRIGDRVKVYSLTEITLRSVCGDGTRILRTLIADNYGSEVASQIDANDWTPPDGHRVSLQTAADAAHGSTFQDVTDYVTPSLRAECKNAADQIGLRFGRFDVKAESLKALQHGDFYILEVNGSLSLDLSLYDEQYPLPVKIERLRAHWDQLFQQAQPCFSEEQNSWHLLTILLWFTLAPKQYAASFWNKVDNGELTSGA